jgi:DNA polymerase-3 subunit delta
MARPLYLLSDAIASRDAARCLALLETLLDDGEEPLRILGTLHRSLRQVRAVRSLKEKRASREEISARLNLPPNMAFKVPALVEAAGRWSDAELKGAVLGIAAQDRNIKNGADTRTALTAAVVGACARTSRPRSGPRPWPRTAR